MEAYNNQEIIGAVEPAIIRELVDYFTERKNDKANQATLQSPPNSYLLSFLDWAITHKNLFTKADQDNLEYLSNTKRNTPHNRIYMFDDKTVEYLLDWLDRYDQWLMDERRHILFSTRLKDMTGYQFESFLKQIGLINKS